MCPLPEPAPVWSGSEVEALARGETRVGRAVPMAMQEKREREEHRRPTILVVDDDPDDTVLLLAALRRRVPHAAVERAACVAEATGRLGAAPVDALLLDLALPDGEGLSVVRHARRSGREIPFVVLSADASAGSAVRALREGAADYLVKGGSAFDRAAGVLSTLVSAAHAACATATSSLVGDSAAMRALRADVLRCGRSRACVRIEGETGVGKELVARSVHAASERARGPFVALNCGALPEGLAEAELFGHVRGAYTGAAADRAGLVEHGAGGTLLLDEIEDLALPIQGKLLRLVQESEYRPVGTARLRRADVRILAASNRDLAAMVRAGAFRRDLFYRLDVLRVRVPPLRERLGDLRSLVAHLLARPAGRAPSEAGEPLLPLAEELAAMRQYDWPGHVRELENFVERARAVACVAGWRAGWASALAQLPGTFETVAAEVSPTIVAECSPEEAERRALESVLSRHRWRREVVARELGISRVTLWRRMRRHGLTGDA